MRIESNDPRWKTADGELKNKEVLHLNEDLNDMVKSVQKFDDSLAKVYDEISDKVRTLDIVSVPPLTQLGKALGKVGDARHAMEEASKLLNHAAQYFGT